MTQRVKSTIAPPPPSDPAFPLDRLAGVSGPDWATPQDSSWDDNLKAKMSENSVNNPERNEEGISMSKGKAGASSEAHQSNKQSIADLIQAIKTDPEIKRLLDNALVEDKSSATDLDPERRPTVTANSAQQVSTTATNARDGSSSCETGSNERAACVVGNCAMWERAANTLVDQVGYDGDWPEEREPVTTSSKIWTDNLPLAPAFNRWTSRFSCPTKLVVVHKVKYTIHDPIFDIMFPAKSASTSLVALGDGSFLVPEINHQFFANILEYAYTQDRKYLHNLSRKDLNQALAFADKYGSTDLSSALIPVLQLDFSHADFSRRAADIYRSKGKTYSQNQEFREYFRETLKTELQSRLEKDTSEEFLSQTHVQLSDAGLALLDVAQVLNSLWSTAELRVEHADPGEHWSDGGDSREQDDADKTEDEEVYSSSGDGWEPTEYKWPVGNGWIQGDNNPQPACEAAQGNFRNDNVPVTPVIMPPEDVLPEFPHQQQPFASWDAFLSSGLSRQANDTTQTNSKATSLQSISALARCVYHWIEHRDLETVITVAAGLGCTEDEADRAFEELELADVVRCVLGLDGVTAYCVKQELRQAPASPEFLPSNLNPAQEHGIEAEPHAPEAPSDKARRAYDWLRQKEANSSWAEEWWFLATQIAEGIGCTVADTLLALHELEGTWSISTRQTVCGFTEYCASG